MKMLSVVFLSVMLFVSLACAGTVKYNPEEFKDAEKMIKKLAEKDIKVLKKNNIKKLVIVECIGEFVTSKEKADAFGNFAWQGGTTYTKNITVGSDYYESVANAVYDYTKQAFVDNGIAIEDKDVLIKNQDYIDLGLAAETKGGGYQKGGLSKNASVTKTVKRSTTGMGMIEGVFSGLFQVAKLNKIIPKIAKETGSDGVLRIKFYVDSGKKGAPIVSMYDVQMDCNIGEANAGKGKVDYYFKTTQAGIFTLKTAVESTAEIVSDKKGTMDMNKYNDELLGIFSSISGIYSQIMKKDLASK